MISFIVTAFNRPLALRTCLSSLIQQTNEDWEAMVVDNSTEHGWKNAALTSLDSRIQWMDTNAFTGMTEPNPSGHKYSLYKATELGIHETTGQWLCLPNCDSYYCPWFAERMLKAAEKNQWDLVYCDVVMGGAGGHHLLETSPRLCCIDKTCFIMRREWFQGFFQGHGDGYPQADGLMIEELVRRGIRHGRVPECLVVHN